MTQITINKNRRDSEKFPAEWVPHPDGGEYLIYGLHKTNFQHFQNIHLASEKAIRESGVFLSDEDIENGNRKFSGIIGKYLVADWKDIPVDLKFSPENSEALMMYGETRTEINGEVVENKNYGMDLALWIYKQAKVIQERAIVTKVQAVGKLKNTTDGKRATQACRKSRKSKDKPLE